MSTPREIAEAFSGHRFREAYAALAPDVRWNSVGEGAVTGREAVVEACEAGTDVAAVDVIGRYTDAAGEVTRVSSCDVYEFRDGLVSSITSYAVELL